MVTISVFFDFSKAFDRVNHPLLFRRLRGLHFSSVLRWIESYLKDRSQMVYNHASGTVSAMTPVNAGVSQGSVLGPLLFSLYISDFNGILRHCKYNFYADDLQVYLHCEPQDLQGGILKLNEDIA